MTEKSKTFCVMPYTHLNFKHQGMVTACWRNQAKLGDYRTQSIEEIWNSEEFQDLRAKLNSGEFPDGCKSCLDLEKSNTTSTRTKCNKTFDYLVEETYPETIPIKRIKTIEIRFNNLCNLRCLHCNNKYSSKWEVEVNRNPAIKKLYEDEDLSNFKGNDFLPQKIIDDIVENVVPHLEGITITGGEPLIQKEHDVFLERILPYAKNIVLNYSSNLNLIKTVITLWKEFKEVNLIISIDGIPETYSYLRTFGKIQELENNIKYIRENLNNVSMVGTCTTSIYNITKFIDIIRYYNNLGVLFHTSLVQYPDIINVKVLPEEMKRNITTELTAFIENLEHEDIWQNPIWNNSKNKQIRRIKSFTENILLYMNSEDTSYLWERTKNYIRAMDKLNSTEFFNLYPEFEKYWQQ